MTNKGSPHAGAEELPIRSFGKLVLTRQFGLLFWGSLVSFSGIWVHSIVAAIAIYGATGSTLWAGMVSIAQYAPQILLSPLSGKRADQGNVGRQVVIGRGLSGFGSGVAAVFCLVQGTPKDFGDAIVILLATLLTGLGFVIGGPAQQVVIPLIIREGELPAAMALNSLPMTCGRVVGPGAGALVAAVYSPGAGFLVATLAHALFVLFLLLASLPAGISRDGARDYRIRVALGYIRRDRGMLVLLLSVAAVGFASEPTITLAPPIAEALGAGDRFVGQLTSVFGVGAAIGFLALRLGAGRVRQSRLLQCGLALMATGTAGLAIAPGVSSSLTAFAVSGIGFMLANTSATTLIQERVPPDLRGRVMALWMVGFLGSRPLAAAIEGTLADLVSLAAAIIVTAAVPLAILAFIRPNRITPPALR